MPVDPPASAAEPRDLDPRDAEIEVLHAQLQAERAARLAAEAARDAYLAQVNALSERVEALERRLGRDSSNSGKPPSSDNPYKKAKEQGKTDHSLRAKSPRKPGKQRGDDSSTLLLSDHPDLVVPLWPGECCGHQLGPGDVVDCRRAQVTDVAPPVAPVVTEYRQLTCVCPRCGIRHAPPFPAGVGGRAGYGLALRARAGLLLFVHHLPVRRAGQVLAHLSGVAVSTGWLAGLRGQAAKLAEPFMTAVRDLLRHADVLHVDETPANTGGSLAYVHVACTRFLTHLHVGDRSSDTIDKGGVLPGYSGVIVRDGYAGYQHLTDAVHAWCGAHLLRDLAGVYDFAPAQQQWAADMATVLSDAHKAAQRARADSKTHLPGPILADLLARYTAAYAKGLADNHYRSGPTAKDALRLARRFRDHQDVITTFVLRTDVPFTNNQAEQDCRVVKVQQRTSGGCWRTLTGLADFAILQSYLSTARKWGIDLEQALHDLFAGRPWIPSAAQPP